MKHFNTNNPPPKKKKKKIRPFGHNRETESLAKDSLINKMVYKQKFFKLCPSIKKEVIFHAEVSMDVFYRLHIGHILVHLWTVQPKVSTETLKLL